MAGTLVNGCCTRKAARSVYLHCSQILCFHKGTIELLMFCLFFSNMTVAKQFCINWPVYWLNSLTCIDYNVQDQFESDAAYYKALGYREEDGKLESTDDYVARMAAYMTFYGAMVQVSDLSHVL